ncbi:acrylyl-CoA reductase (NADPH) [Parafrigoribacterium soli]|uniref:acrylyl-CoA reductase (NADPH) n=1 Tax=Parafrigoribacterium soli TaxID=3144663 RepID=UPI0032ECB986
MFRALWVSKGDAAVTTEVTELTDDDLMPGDVTIDVEYSSLNYKDALAIAGRPGVIRQYPLVPGIDLVGTVAASEDPRWISGDRVILNGWGIGETHHGGLAERARVNGDWLVRLPQGIDAARAAGIGTAGYTAMLAVLALERAGIVGGETPGRDILVTGAAGGVGSVAIALLARLGAHVVASTGRTEEAEYLRRLGASEVIDRATLSEPGKPLQSQHWAGAIDSVGGSTLANVLAQTSYGGTVASCGLAQSAELPTTVMPFILRAVTLTGINSVLAPRELREEAWARLESDLDQSLLDGMTSTIGLTDAAARAEDVLAGRVRGRLVVDVHG